MSSKERLWQLLMPLGPYCRQGAVYTDGELSGEGTALDGVSAALDELEREAMLDTAESYGLEEIEGLLIHRPVAQSKQARRAALSALLRIGGDSYTLSAINDNLKGCGLNAAVRETQEPGLVEVYFPDVPGIPEGFEALKKILEEIIPCHLEIRYVYWYITWKMVEEKFDKWKEVGEGSYAWGELEKLVK